ncbi:MAG: AAA family ATPase [Nitrospinales bacterium]
MKIQNLKIRGFRGFNDETDLSFTTGLNLVYAPNGWGKSSLAEAIEWAVFGDTQRTLDAKSKIEFEGSHRNVHFGGNNVCVGVDCQKNGETIEILREMDSREEISLCITPDTCTLPETWLVRPIIYQHALQRFIHTEPKKRWDEFANILGLTDLEKLRETLVKVKNQGQKAIPDEARQYITKLNQVRSTINGFDELSDLKRPSETNAASLALTAKNAGETIVESEGGDKSKLKAEISRILKKRKAEILDVSIFSLKDLDAESKGQYEADKQYIAAFNEQALEKIIEYRSQKIADLDTKRCNFIKSGLELLPLESDVCPFCGEHTITDELKGKLNKDIEASSKTGELHEKILKALEQIRVRVSNTAQHFLPRMKNAPTVQAGKIEGQVYV